MAFPSEASLVMPWSSQLHESPIHAAIRIKTRLSGIAPQHLATLSDTGETLTGM